MAELERSEHSLAIFVDFENLALGFQNRRDRFDIQRVLKRLVEKGKVVVKKAYADWNRYASYTATLHEAAIELIEIPHRSQSGKNSADIRLCVDAMDLAYSKDHIDTFVVVSGDSDFSPLVSKLKELGKHLIGMGMQGSTSELLRDNCDEFIYYEDLDAPEAELPNLDPQLPETKRKAFTLLMDSLQALRRENKEHLWSSMIKDTMKRKKPSFNETYHGYPSFSALLEDAQRQGLIELETHKRSGTYVVTRFGNELKTRPSRDARLRASSSTSRSLSTRSGTSPRTSAERTSRPPLERRTPARPALRSPSHELTADDHEAPSPQRVIREIKEQDQNSSRTVLPQPSTAMEADSEATPPLRMAPRRALPASTHRPAEADAPPARVASNESGVSSPPERRPVRRTVSQPEPVQREAPALPAPAAEPPPELPRRGNKGNYPSFGAGILDDQSP